MLRQNLQQKLLQKLSPQQIQLMKLLQVPTVALEQRIKEEIEMNPALEEGLENDEEEENNNEEDEEFDNSETATENEREDFNLGDYMDDDEASSYKLQT